MTPLPFDPAQLHYIISTLDEADRESIKQHLLRLNHEDRYLRFFATLSDGAVKHYVDSVMDFKTGKAFGVLTVPDRKLVALAHVGEIERTDHRISAEVGFSVDAEYRGKGLSKRLMDRVVTYCRSHGINTLFMSCLRENRRMQAVARDFDLRLVINADEAMAELQLDGSDRERAIPQEIAYEQISIFDKAYRQNQALLDAIFNAK